MFMQQNFGLASKATRFVPLRYTVCCLKGWSCWSAAQLTGSTNCSVRQMGSYLQHSKEHGNADSYALLLSISSVSHSACILTYVAYFYTHTHTHTRKPALKKVKQNGTCEPLVETSVTSGSQPAIPPSWYFLWRTATQQSANRHTTCSWTSDVYWTVPSFEVIWY